MSVIKIYQDSKELPFWNYKRIIQTGDFLYMVKNYESGDEIEADKSVLEEKFNEVVQDYVVSLNTKNEDIVKYGSYLFAQNEINKLSMVIEIISIKQVTNKMRESLNMEIDNSDIKDLLQNFKIEKSDDLEIQKQKLLVKIEKHNNDILRLKSSLDKDDAGDGEVDIEEQYLSVCLGLEMHVDPRKISLYEYGVMIKILVKKIDTLNKAQNR